ncbi:MAG: response regulator, partial [Arcobacteraceae bacterium]|nr:response regulator [Arcobacteraceae bacterium]
MLDNENFRIAVINNIKNSSTLISETLRDYGYECISYNSADIAYKNIVNDNLDLIIINSDESTNIQKEIIQNIKSISTVNIIFLTSEIDDIIKNDFLNLYLLDYKIKLNNILTILSEIDTLIKRLILNQKETILIIRKENDVRVQIESLLKLRNYNLILASNGALGWKALSNTNDISMILLDINLRDMDSLEIIAKAKNKFSKDIPIIALTTIYNPITLQQNISNGLSDLIKIPIINEEFNLKIDLWIDNVRQKKEIYKQQVQLEQTLNGFIALSNATIEGLIMFENNICVDAN